VGRGTVLAEGLLIQYRVQSRAYNVHGPPLASELEPFTIGPYFTMQLCPIKHTRPMRPSAAICSLRANREKRRDTQSH
jgi:hypothetical protein